MSVHVVGLCLACLAFGSGIAWSIYRQFEARISLPEIYAFVIPTLYGLGALIPYLFYSKRERMDLLNGLGVGEADIAYALLVVLAFSFVIWLFRGIRNSASVGTARLRSMLAPLATQRTYHMVALSILAFQCVWIATGKLGFQGLQHPDDDYHISPLAAFCMPLGLMVLLLSGFRFATARGRWLIVAAIALQLSIVMIQGRRYLAIAVFFLGLGILLNRPSWRQVLWLIVGASVTVWLGVRLFTAMRVVKGAMGAEATLLEVTQEGFAAFVTGKTTEGVVLNEVLKENLSERPVIIAYLAQLVALREQGKGSWGKIFVNSLLTAVPSKIFPAKVYWMLEGSEEDIAAKELGISDAEDSANTILTASYTEAREAGVIIYALIVLSFLWLMMKAINCIRMPWLFLLAFVTVVFQTIFIEEAFVSWFVTLRVVCLFAVADIAWRVALKANLPAAA